MLNEDSITPSGTVETKAIKPIGDLVLIKRNAVREISKGGIHLPPQGRQRTAQGIVVAVGPGKVGKHGDRIPIEVTVGQEVMVSQYGGTEIMFSGSKHILIAASDIIANVERE